MKGASKGACLAQAFYSYSGFSKGFGWVDWVWRYLFGFGFFYI